MIGQSIDWIAQKLHRLLMQCKRFIFTGTPGSGKTSVIRELEKLGHAVIHEAATDVITDAQLNGIERPWEKPEFIDHITCMQKERQMNTTADVQFYDRSPFCTYALSKYLGYDVSTSLHDEMERCFKNDVYKNQVFFFENLGFIELTSARKISYEEALIFEKIHLDIYNKFGFDIVMVPKELTVTQRCDFILDYCVPR